MTTIRAWGYEQKFTDMVRVRANDYTRPFYLIRATGRWLSFRDESYAYVVSLTTGLFIMWNMDSIDAGQAGFALTYALTFPETVLVCSQMVDGVCRCLDDRMVYAVAGPELR